MSTTKWQFAPRFRRHAFGWKSQPPIQRIKEALSEIRKVARQDPKLAAEGAILFLEKLSPALEQVDSSSGAIGSAVNVAIEALVPVIAKPIVPYEERERWLKRLWEALQNDHMPYIELLGDYWGELCAEPKLASVWADEFISIVKLMWNPQESKRGSYFKGTTACLSALFSAGRYEELLALIEMAPYKSWSHRYWGVQALVAMGKPREALCYAENSHGLNNPVIPIAQKCEEILIAMGLNEEAYENYALAANQTTTNLSTFRAIVKKYPSKEPIAILKDLIKSQPGSEGKWFAAAKSAGFFDLAIELVSKSPTDPQTLTRAAKEYALTHPDFAIASGMASLYWIIRGFGYEISSIDVHSAYSAIMNAAKAASIEEQAQLKILNLLGEEHSHTQFVKGVLQHYLNER